MAYDPVLTSFIIVGVVGGLAAFLNISSDWEISGELARATDGWTAPMVVRSYRNDSTARQKVTTEAAVLQGHGYTAALQRGGSADLALGGAASTGRHVVLPEMRASGMIVIAYQLT